MMSDRVAIFIDGSNLYHALKANFGRQDLNFSEFATKLCGSRRLFRTYYYNVLQDPTQWPEGHREQQEFLNILRMTPYLEVRLGTTKIGQGVPVEKGIDIMLATDLLYFAWNDSYDIAVLVSGDGDFAYALQAVKNMGKYVEVAYFRNSISKDLLDIADNRHLLDRSFFSGLWGGKRHNIQRRRSGGKPKSPPSVSTRETPTSPDFSLPAPGPAFPRENNPPADRPSADTGGLLF
jgi:uncharacterized LabA/DUF88 family protein